jgi:hypothetical protein
MIGLAPIRSPNAELTSTSSRKYSFSTSRRLHSVANLHFAQSSGGVGSFSRSGAELLFQVFADRYERTSTLITSNLPFSEWQQIFQGERMTAALLDRLTHHCEIFEMNGESYRFRESLKEKQATSSAKSTSPKANP